MTRLAKRVMDVPATFISLVDGDRDFYLSQAGMPEPLAIARELGGRTFCHYTLGSESALALDDTAGTPVFQDVPTVRSLGVRAYLGIPMRSATGHNIGSFCAIDVEPRQWSDHDIEILTELSRSAVREIELRSQLRSAIERERQTDCRRWAEGLVPRHAGA